MPDSDVPAEDILRIALDSGRTAIVWHWRTHATPLGAIAFSHGNASSPAYYAALIGPWLAAGYDVWAPLHVDSSDHPDGAEYPGLASWRARIEDMRVVSALIGEPYVVIGHSYGALTALATGGAEGDLPEGLGGPMRDPLAACVVALSPPPPIPGLISPEGYAALAVPALIQTGTADAMPGWPDPDWRVHLPAYDCTAPGGDRYLAVLDGVDHDFGGAICEVHADTTPQTDALADTGAIAALFVRAAFHHDASARAALDAHLSDIGPVRLARK
jgi:pimeloyl-ACP methyl ester carboxylesterase